MGLGFAGKLIVRGYVLGLLQLRGWGLESCEKWGLANSDKLSDIVFVTLVYYPSTLPVGPSDPEKPQTKHGTTKKCHREPQSDIGPIQA